MFNVGDRVVGVLRHDGNEDVIDNHGTVIRAKNGLLTVQFDKKIISGHTGPDGTGRSGYCWNYPYNVAERKLIYEQVDAPPISFDELF